MDSRILPHNEHALDRGVRVALGAMLLVLVFAGPHTPWGWLGIIPLLTGVMGSCPLYTLLGVSTCRTGKTAGERNT